MAKLSRQKLASFAARQLVEGKDPKRVMRELAAYLIDHKMDKQTDQLLNDLAVELQRITGTAEVAVTSARELTQEAQKRLTGFVRELLGAKNVVLSERQDPSLLGGFILRTPEYEYDASIRRKLNQLASTKGDI